MAAAARAHTHALACFADGRPLVSAAEREGLEGVPDWVDNTHKVVQVVAPRGLVAPTRVLIDGGSFYSMAGAALKAPGWVSLQRTWMRVATRCTRRRGEWRPFLGVSLGSPFPLF